MLALCIRTLKVFNLGKNENSFRRNWELHSSHNAGSWKGLLGGGFKYFLFLPLPGEMIQFDEHIFSNGLKLKPPTSLDWNPEI